MTNIVISEEISTRN